MWASPHSFRSRLKTNYNAHMAAACGNVVTIEGVTCISDDIDYGEEKITYEKIKNKLDEQSLQKTTNFNYVIMAFSKYITCFINDKFIYRKYFSKNTYNDLFVNVWLYFHDFLFIPKLFEKKTSRL